MYCHGAIAGGMVDGDEMEKEMADFSDKMRGKLMRCSDCKAIYDFDSWEKLNEDEARRSDKEIIELCCG
jgi:hypothetical protein